MTLFSNNSIFKPNTKHIKFHNSNINVISGANTLSFLPLCDIKADYEQYQRLSVTIPKNTEDFLLSFFMLGVKVTFLAIKVNYPNSKNKNNYLKWKFTNSMDPKKVFTSLLMFTGTTNNPISNLLIDNDSDCDIQLEILVAGMENDNINDPNLLLYLTNLEFINIKTVDEDTTEILAFHNSDDELQYTLPLSDLNNFSRYNNENKIIINTTNDETIILDFKDEYETLQTLSAINWLLQDPTNRALPKSADNDAPIITFTPLVNVDNEMAIDLSTYSNTFTKINFIDDAIDNILDNVDGIIIPTIDNITILNNNVEINEIVNVGTYTIEINIKDIAGNETTEIVTIIVT